MSNGNNSTLLIGRKLSEFKKHDENDPNELLKYRFLCREGVLGLYGQTGIGKSSLAMQLMIQWSLEREAFGIIPAFPIKSLLVQAENDDGDIAEMRDGIITGLELTPEEAQQAGDNIIVIQEDSKTGIPFFQTVALALETHKPDLLWIDPALAYLGGDTLSQKEVGAFLRNQLKPLLTRYKCGCVIIHHMNKTGSGDTAYAGSGSAEWANMPRAILTLTEKGNALFELKATKRSGKLRWKTPNGTTTTDSRQLTHSAIEDRIYWEEVGLVANPVPTSGDSKIEDGIVQCVPEMGTISKEVLIRNAVPATGIGENKVRKKVKQMLTDQKIFETDVPRANARPEKHISRQRPPELSPPVADGVANGHK